MAQSIQKLMIRSLLLLLLLVLGCQTINDLTSQPKGPWTRAELTDAKQTSSLADVNAFIAELKKQGAPIVVSTLGKSAGGVTSRWWCSPILPVATETRHALRAER